MNGKDGERCWNVGCVNLELCHGVRVSVAQVMELSCPWI